MNQIISPQETQGNTIAQPVQAVQAETSFLRRTADRVMDNARPLALGLAIATGVGAAANEVVSPDSAAAGSKPAWKEKYCENGNMNTILCLGDAAAQCDRISSSTTFDIKANYIKGSRSKYQVKGTSEDMGACAPVGAKELTIWQEKRMPGETEFTRSSSVMKLMTGKKASKFKKTVKAPYTCDSGPIEIRAAVGTRFIAKKGTGIKSSKRYVRYEQTKTLC